jgi:hypothetical protein
MAIMGSLAGLCIVAPISDVTPAATIAESAVLTAGQTLGRDQRIVAPNGSTRFVMRPDGDAVVYGPDARWATRTTGAGNRLYLQTDGNLVVYSTAGRALWSSATRGSKATHLVIQPDANLVLRRADEKAVWSSVTGPLPVLSMYAYGNSYVLASGATDPAHGFVALAGARLRATTDNNGTAGAVMGQVVGTAGNAPGKSWAPGSQGLVILDAVLNSVINVTSRADAAEKVDFPSSLRTLLRMYRSRAWRPETDASVVRAGAWTTAAVTSARNGSAIKTVVPGEHLTITTSASEISLMLIGFPPSSGAGSPYSVRVNGVPRASGTTVGRTTERTTFHDVAVRITGLTGTSTVVLTKGAGAGELYVDGYLETSSTPPEIVVVKDPIPTSAGLAVNGRDANRTAANLAAFDAMVDSVVAEQEFHDGTVRVADPGARWNAATMYALDHVHPNNLGHSVLADVVAGAAG